MLDDTKITQYIAISVVSLGLFIGLLVIMALDGVN